MFGVPHKVNPLTMRILGPWIAASAFCSCGGCVTTAPRIDPPLKPIAFTIGEPPALVTIYRDLTERVLPVATVSRLEAFLYGPAKPPRRRLRNPFGMAVHGQDLYVCDQGLPAVVRVDLATGRMKALAKPRERPACPIDIAVDCNGQVYVADVTGRCIFVYDAEGRFQRKLIPQRDDADSFVPSALLVDGSTLFVADRGTHRIDRYEIDQQRWASTPFVGADRVKLGAPTGLAMTGDGVLLVADALRGVVHRLARDGTPLSPIGERGRGPGQLVRPMQVACGTTGRIYVTDAAKQSVVVFGADGGFLFEVAGLEDRWKGMTLPMGVVSFRDGLYVEPGGRAVVDDRTIDWMIVSDGIGAGSLIVLRLEF